MGENTKIEWARHTFNGWVGCTHRSPACEFCYAESWAARFGKVGWGQQAPRRRTTAENWKKPLKWNAAAEAAGERHTVFAFSLADWMDDHASIQPGWRTDFEILVKRTPSLTWLLLTKRPENWQRFIPTDRPNDTWGRNVRLGVTIEDQRRFDELSPYLIEIASLGWPTFVSYESALGPVDWRPAFEAKAIGWLISGGESGAHARPSHPDWHRAARDICAEFGVPYLFKQRGEWTWIDTGDYDSDRIPDVPLTWRNHPDRFRCIRNDGSAADGWGGDSAEILARVGKKRAGRLLDGIEYNGRPEARR